MSGIEWGLAIVCAALGTYFLRVAPFTIKPLRALGERYLHFLTYVSFAIAAGIVSKSLLVADGVVALHTDLWIKLVALGSAVVLQRMIGNMPAALFAGVAVAVFIKWWLG